MQNEGLLNHKGHKTQTKRLGHMHFSMLKIQNFHKVLTKSVNQENCFSGKNMEFRDVKTPSKFRSASYHSCELSSINYSL